MEIEKEIKKHEKNIWDKNLLLYKTKEDAFLQTKKELIHFLSQLKQSIKSDYLDYDESLEMWEHQYKKETGESYLKIKFTNQSKLYSFCETVRIHISIEEYLKSEKFLADLKKFEEMLETVKTKTIQEIDFFIDKYERKK